MTLSRPERIDELYHLVDDVVWREVMKMAKENLELGLPLSISALNTMEHKAIATLLEEGIMELVPKIHNTGRPISIGNTGMFLYNLREVPELVVVEEVDFIDKKDPSNWEDVQQLKPSDPRVKTLLTDGYEYTAKWKGLVELTLFKAEDKTPEPEDISIIPDRVYLMEGEMETIGVVFEDALLEMAVKVRTDGWRESTYIAGEDLKAGDIVGRWPPDPELERIMEELDIKVVDTSHLENEFIPDEEDPEACPRCRGHGEIPVYDGEHHNSKCPDCDGTGRVKEGD